MSMNSRWLKLAGVAAALAGAPAFIATLHALEFDRGEALYENHCSACHDPQAHVAGEARHVVTLADLHARVAAWSVHSGLHWSEEDVNDVTDYLNRRFYRFAETP
ncbi:MAG: c-type cytochrome [Gammaproteobacteria bacterium]